MFEPNNVASAGSALHAAAVLIQEDFFPSTGSPTTHLQPLFDQAALPQKNDNNNKKKIYQSQKTLLHKIKSPSGIISNQLQMKQQQQVSWERTSYRGQHEIKPIYCKFTMTKMRGKNAFPQTIRSKPRVVSTKLTCSFPCVPPGSPIPAFF